MIKDYLRSRVKVIVLIIVIEAVFASSYFLFDMPVVTVLYPLILSILIIIAAGITDLLITAGKHKKLSHGEMPDSVDILGKIALLAFCQQRYFLVDKWRIGYTICYKRRGGI